ncbi:unnamed protein product [Rhizophagus irregularis]|nr:unnamed protein product [Rhizophagus irregularis]
MFGVIFNKTANNVGITVEYMDQKTLQLPQFIQLNLSENLSKIRQRLNDRGIINSTLSFVRKYDGNSRFAEIAFEEEENISLNEIVRKSEDTRILSLTTCSKFNWKVLNQLRKLDYGCTMTSDGIKKADKRAFEMKDCIFEEIGNEECKAGEFNSSSCEKEMMDKNLFFNADINVKYFVKSGIGKLFGTSNNKTSHVKTDYSYSFIMYGKALLKLNFEHLEPTQEFIKVVEKALSSKDPAEQFKQIVKDFGQFIPTEVILGGRVHFDDFAKSVKLSTEKSGEMSGKLSIEDLKIKMGSYKYTKIIGGEQPDDIKNLDIGNWVGSLNNCRYWDCIEFRNPISIFQFLPKDSHERIIKSFGLKIHYSTIETCDLVLEEYRKPINFKLEFPTDIKKIIKNKDVNCKIFATVTDITKSKNDFFTCQVLCPSDGRLPSLIIHRVQNPFKIFKKRECKLHIGWMVIGYYRDFYFDFSTRLKIQKNDFNAPDTDNLIEYDSKVPICLGTPVLSEYPKNESLIIGYYYYVQEEMNKIKACTFAYCLEDRQLVNLPNFTFYTLIITNYHNHGTCDLITLRKKGYSNFNTESPKFVSIYSAEQTDCVFLKQRNGQIKIKKIGNDKTNLSYKCAIFDPYTREDSIQEQSKLDKRTTKYDSQNKIAAFDNHQLEDKDDIINKLQQQTEKLERKLNEETRKYQVSRDKLDVGKSSKLSEEKSELNEEKSELDEETIKHQDSIENFTALNDQLITKDINKFRQQTEKLERQLNEETGKYQVFRDKFTSFNKKLKDKKVAENEDNFAQEIEKNENEIETFKRYEKSAKQDDSDAQNYLGYFYENDLGVQKDLEKAFYWYQRSAENGNKLAHYNLISYYLNGRNIDEKLVKQENDKMQYILGYFYEIKKDSEKSFYWYLKSAENGNKFAQYNLGLYYQNGWGIEKDEIKAFIWYEKSAKQDNSDAQNYLGFLYKNGINIQKDLEKSFFWYQKSAINGNKIAQYNLGNFYRYGWGIEKDEIEAQKWYKKLAGPHNKFFVKNEELLQNINAENKETIINDITNDNPFNYIQFNEPIINTNCEIDSIFITVKATISPGISDTSYIEVEKLQKLLINRKDDIDHILELQPVYTIGIDFQKNSTRPCVACWVAKSLDITVLECLETIFENQFNIIYKIVTPLNEDNNQNLNKSKEFDDNSLTIYYNEENLEEENRNKNNYGNSSGSGSNNDHNSNNNNGNNNNGNNNNGSNSNNNKSGDDSNNISNNNSGDGSNNNNGGGDDGGNGGGGSNGNKSIFISSRVNAVFDSKYSQDFRINVELWANFEDTLKYNLDVYACGIGELLNNTCQSLNKIGFGYILQSIKVQVSPLPNNGGDLFDLKRGSQPTQLNQNVEFLVGSEMNINGNIGISTTPGVDITGGYKKNNNTKYSSREWEFNYKGPIDKGEYWLYERNKNLDKIDSTYAPGVHSGEWFVKNGMHGFCITITQVLRYEITHWWHKIPLNMKTSLQKFPMMAHNLEVTFNDLNDFNNKFKKLKPTMYSTNGNITNTVGSNEMENKVKTPNIENLNEIGKIERSLGSV